MGAVLAATTTSKGKKTGREGSLSVHSQPFRLIATEQSCSRGLTPPFLEDRPYANREHEAGEGLEAVVDDRARVGEVDAPADRRIARKRRGRPVTGEYLEVRERIVRRAVRNPGSTRERRVHEAVVDQALHLLDVRQAPVGVMTEVATVQVVHLAGCVERCHGRNRVRLARCG